MAVPTPQQVVTAVELLARSATRGGTVPDTGTLLTDCLRVVYRLVFADLARRRGGLLTAHQAVADLDLGVVDMAQVADVLVDLVAILEVQAGGRAGDGPEGSTSDAAGALGAIHESVLARSPELEAGRLRLRVATPETDTRRRATGAYFTPSGLVAWLTAHTVDPVVEEAGREGALAVLDPACGAGVFLVAACRALRRRGRSLDQVLCEVVGVDRDAAALEVARVSLWLEGVEPGKAVAMPALRLHLADALLDEGWEEGGPPGGYDAVVGNPPFLNQLERRTAHRPGVAARLNERSHGALRPYTDVSAVFLQRSVDWVRPGGRVGLVQPQSLLAARDAGGVRAYVAATCALQAMWASDVPVFDAHVLTCAPVLRKAAAQGPVRRFHGPGFDELAPRPAPELGREWSFLLAAGLGIPELALPRGPGVLADLADCTADFRDQYYGLAPYVREAGSGTGSGTGREPGSGFAPLVTSGLIDPALVHWGARRTRFLKQSWDAPAIDLAALREDPALHRWASRRLVPKILVGTQGKVIEAVVDEAGRWLPSVPTITVVPAAGDLWHLLAVLLAPPVSAHAAARFAGTALSMRAIKLSAAQVGRLPLPPRSQAWDLGAEAVRRAQQEPALRSRHLADAGRHMCAAYGVGEESFDWWLDRLLDGAGRPSAGG